MSDQASTSGSVDNVNQDPDARFIKHKVSRHDNLAGLAVKYGVSVSDIKRANGLMSDTALFALETVMIPKEVLPVGEDVHMMLAQIVSGLGRDPQLNSDAWHHPGSTAMAMATGSAHSRATGRVDSAFVQGLGLLRIDEREPLEPAQELASMSSGWLLDREGSGSLRRLRTQSDPGDVELSERPSHEDLMSNWTGSGLNQNVRQRRRQDTQEEEGCEVFEPWWGGQANGSNGHAHNSTGPTPASQGQPSAMDFFTKLTHTIKESSLIQKIRKAASQPALATAGPMIGFGDAADAVLGVGNRTRVQQQEPLLPASILAPRHKDGGKDD